MFWDGMSDWREVMDHLVNEAEWSSVIGGAHCNSAGYNFHQKDAIAEHVHLLRKLPARHFRCHVAPLYIIPFQQHSLNVSFLKDSRVW